MLRTQPVDTPPPVSPVSSPTSFEECIRAVVREQIVLNADEKARLWRNVRAADLAEELAGNDAVPILVRSEQGGVARGEIAAIERDGERVTVGAYKSGVL